MAVTMIPPMVPAKTSFADLTSVACSWLGGSAAACAAKSRPALAAYGGAFAALAAWFAYYSFFLAQPRRKVFATPNIARGAREMDGHGDDVRV